METAWNCVQLNPVVGEGNLICFLDLSSSETTLLALHKLLGVNASHVQSPGQCPHAAVSIRLLEGTQETAKSKLHFEIKFTYNC